MQTCRPALVSEVKDVIAVDKTVLRLLHEKVAEPETLQCLITLERCFWILETVSNYITLLMNFY